ncbi:hypothetical protein BDR26DRAFT_873491 [Obelidium mucronatum]|nr:hypothetical protein BDR26DRAFT_873491 [Obelidium mucronatum]
MAMSVHKENMRELSARLETQDAKVAKCEHDLNQAIAARESGEILNALRSLYEGASRERQGLINERVALINERAMKKQEVTYSSEYFCFSHGIAIVLFFATIANFIDQESLCKTYMSWCGFGKIGSLGCGWTAAFGLISQHWSWRSETPAATRRGSSVAYNAIPLDDLFYIFSSAKCKE